MVRAFEARDLVLGGLVFEGLGVCGSISCSGLMGVAGLASQGFRVEH